MVEILQKVSIWINYHPYLKTSLVNKFIYSMMPVGTSSRKPWLDFFRYANEFRTLLSFLLKANESDFNHPWWYNIGNLVPNILNVFQFIMQWCNYQALSVPAHSSNLTNFLSESFGNLQKYFIYHYCTHYWRTFSQYSFKSDMTSFYRG